MNEQIEARLAELRAERQRGEEMLAEMQQRQAALRDTLLRINGAIQVLEEIQQQQQQQQQQPSAGGGADGPSAPPSIAAA